MLLRKADATITGIIMRTCKAVVAQGGWHQDRHKRHRVDGTGGRVTRPISAGPYAPHGQHSQAGQATGQTGDWPEGAPHRTCAQKTELALPSIRFIARSRPPVCVTPSATRYSIMTVSTPVLLKPVQRNAGSSVLSRVQPMSVRESGLVSGGGLVNQGDLGVQQVWMRALGGGGRSQGRRLPQRTPAAASLRLRMPVMMSSVVIPPNTRSGPTQSKAMMISLSV